MKKSKKVVIVGVVAVLLASGGIGYKVYADSVRKEKIAVEIVIRQTEAERTIKEVNASYDLVQKDFLKKDLSKGQMDELKRVVGFSVNTKNSKSLLKDSEGKVLKSIQTELKDSFDALESKFENQTKTNALFKEVAINGTDVKTDLVIKDDLTDKDLEEIKSESLPENDKWTESIIKILANAKGQLDQIKKATKSVDALFKDKAVIPDVSKEQIDVANKEVASIRNEKAKKTLTERLKPVTELLAKKEADEKAKVEAESKKVAEAQAASNDGTVVQNADGTYSTQAPVVTEAPQTDSNNYQAPITSGGSVSGGSNGGTTAPPVSNGGGSNTGTTPPTTSNGGGTWSGQGTQTGGGTISGGATGGGGDNTWNGGDFDGSGIDTSGWN